MKKLNYYEIFKDNLMYIGLAIGICMILALVFSIVQPKEYSSQIQVMVVPNNANSIDITSASKTSEYVARKLATVIHSVSFLEKVVKSEQVDLNKVTGLEESAKRAM